MDVVPGLPQLLRSSFGVDGFGRNLLRVARFSQPLDFVTESLRDSFERRASDVGKAKTSGRGPG